MDGFSNPSSSGDSETEIQVSIGLDVTAEAPQKIKVESGIGFLDHVSEGQSWVIDKPSDRMPLQP